MESLSSTIMIAKTFFLAKTSYRYSVRIFRDHEIRDRPIPGRVSARDSAEGVLRLAGQPFT